MKPRSGSGQRTQRWLLSDTYPDAQTNERVLFLFDMAQGVRHDLGSYYTSPDLKKENRCDLHPRWSRDGQHPPPRSHRHPLPRPPPAAGRSLRTRQSPCFPSLVHVPCCPPFLLWRATRAACLETGRAKREFITKTDDEHSAVPGLTRSRQAQATLKGLVDR
ncbi:MAG: hypothetical protein ACREYA_37365 [Cupriavidus necator]